MAVNTALQVSELDFDGIKTNLINFIKSKNQFADFDFEGSNLNLMADILAYNTFYNSYYVNQLANESFDKCLFTLMAVAAPEVVVGKLPQWLMYALPIAASDFACNVFRIFTSGLKQCVQDCFTLQSSRSLAVQKCTKEIGGQGAQPL